MIRKVFRSCCSSKSSSMVPNSIGNNSQSVNKDKEQQRRMNSVKANTVDSDKCGWHTHLKGRLKKNSLHGSELSNKENSPFLRDISGTPRSEGDVVVNLTQKENNNDRNGLKPWHLEGYEELERKARAAEEQAQLMLLEEREYLTKSSVKVSSYKKAESESAKVKLLQLKVKKLLQEKRDLVLQVACEIRSRMAERCAVNEVLDLIEKEKNALQSSLEIEFDKRTRELGNKVDKIKMDERRMKDRMQDLVEKNVALQRQVSHLNNKEFTHLKCQVEESTELKTRLVEAENEIGELRQSLTESHQRIKEAEGNLQSIQRCYDEKEVENYALQDSVIRLQRICNDQENIICGLRQAGLQDTPQDKVNQMITKPQQEELLSVSTASMNFIESQDMENIGPAWLQEHEERWPSYLGNEQQLSEVQEELKVQNLISRLLRQKLCSRELQVEQLEEEVVAIKRSRELSKTELARLQNLLGSSTHKLSGLEFELQAKDERINGLEDDWQRCLKNVEELEKNVEKLEEAVMFKDGQISILRESLREIYFRDIH